MTASLSTSCPAALAVPVSSRLLVVGEDLDRFEQVGLFLRDYQGQVSYLTTPAEQSELPDEYDAAIIVQPDLADESDLPENWGTLLQGLERRQVGVLLVGGRPRAGSLLSCWVSARASADELMGRIHTMARYRTILQEVDGELHRLQKLRDQLNRHFEELDQEMRLASRLQRDFLPRETPPLGPLRFATVYQPASWVSGDIYDVFRLDEKHVGFYLADAVGHGVAAGLLTMFIKRAMLTKVIDDGRYRIVPPSEALAALNDSLAGQELPNCQFATVCYGIINYETLQLTVARGGHPYPIHVLQDGTPQEVKSEGGLLGVFAGQQYPCTQVQLKPGDKLVVYSDGVEDFFVGERDAARRACFASEFGEVARLPAGQLASHLRSFIESHEGSLAPADDVTAIIVEVAAEPAASDC